jgi:hypothetical protein
LDQALKACVMNRPRRRAQRDRVRQPHRVVNVNVNLKRSHSVRHPDFRMAFVAALLVATSAMPLSPAVAASESEIAWEACPLPEVPARECGNLTVPLDYDELDGPTISIALARVPATDQAGRIGSLITNPGGPGGSGVEGLALMYAALP